jgi:PKD repeat protein
MKKILLLLVVAFIAAFQVQAQKQITPNPFPRDTANYPYWIEMMQDQTINFFTVQKAFNTYWKDRQITKGSGWKPFKRWEYMMLNRIQADGTRPQADETYRAYMTYKKNIRSSNGNWLSLGPAEIPSPGPAGYEGLGRINVVAFHPTDANKIYIGAPAGGMWQSTDGGATWVSHTDDLPTLGVSAIIIDKNNPNTILIGTGDRDAGDAPGMGVFKSTDGGLTWSVSNAGMGNKTVGKMIQHPTNAQIMIAATNGGIFRSTNGGSSWTFTQGGDFKDVVFKSSDPNIVYAAAGANFYRSVNNGTSFTLITSGLSGGQRGAIAVTAANPGYVYFLVSGNDSGFKGFYRSTDSGLNFTERSSPPPNLLDWSCDGSGAGGQGWYDLAIAANPVNAEDVYVGGVDVWRSTDGGTSWLINSHWYGGCSVPAVHADCHILTYNSVDGQLYAGNDGGVWSTPNSGITWTDHTVGLTIGQIYKVGQSQTLRDKIINGFQDNGTYTHTAAEWLATGGGDGMECAIDYSNPLYTYHTVYYGDIYRTLNNSNEKHIAGNNTFGITESGAWVTPFILHETDPNTMFVGYKNIWRCNSIKANNLTWIKISDNLGGSNGSDMAVLEQSSANTNILYAARYDNKLFRSDNCNADAPAWSDLTSFLPAGLTITDMESHPTDPNILYITMGNAVYKTTDKGLSWTDISDNLTGIHLNTIAFYKNSPEGLYVGSDAGVYYKDPSTAGWIPFSQGLPVNGRITEVEIYYDNDSVSRDAICASTYGRGLWQSDLYHALPQADFLARTTLIPPGCTVGFTDLSTGIPTHWEWTFTGGIPATSSDKNPTNILYLNPGNFPVKLKAWNEIGTDSIIKTDYIAVSNTLIPAVNFGSDKNILCQGEVVHFYDSTSNCPYGWNWEFSPNTVVFIDGTTASSQNPVVQFMVANTYDVKLTSTNGAGSNAITKPGYIVYGGYDLPFEEDFESGLHFKYWSVIKTEGSIAWDTISTVGTSPGHISAWMNFFDNAKMNKRDQMISAPMNFKNYTTVTLTFKHAYAQRLTLKDSLIVYLSYDCGLTWNRILAAGPNSSSPNLFATHAPMTEAFYPTSADDWCGSSYGTDCYSVDLSKWAGLSNIRLMFESFNRHGNNLFIDNINVSGPVGIPEPANGDLFKIYPNPSEGLFNLISKGNTNLDLTISDVRGKTVYTERISSGPGNNLNQLNLSELPKGIYYLKITSEKAIQGEKIIIY